MLNYNTYLNEDTDQWITLIHGAGGSSTIWFKQLRSFKSEFNVLVVDLRGHGKSKFSFQRNYNFDLVTQDIIEVLDQLKIEKSHFVGISLGTILIRNIAEQYPDRIQSMILAGAVMKLNLKSRVLMKLGVVFKSIIPYMLLYKLFAFIIMPKKNHKKSRLLFIQEAKKLYQKEFIKWFKMTAEIKPLLNLFREKELQIPALYLMGAEDHLFLPSVKHLVASHRKSELIIVENCGHVVNVEQPLIFNEKSLNFFRNQSGNLS
jgi:pimeloyl-ACP methyl ester carboxylesterase